MCMNTTKIDTENETNFYDQQDIEFDSIVNMLYESSIQHPNLKAEVIWSAMRFLQNNSNKTIKEACEYGLNEWLK
jgi:hypothetical protein